MRLSGCLALLVWRSFSLVGNVAQGFGNFTDPFERPPVYSLKIRDELVTEGDENAALSFLQKHARRYRYLPSAGGLMECARKRWSSYRGCMQNIMKLRYMEYWKGMNPEDYDVCCNPAKATICKEPAKVHGLPFCGFPFGSVDFLPAYVPELHLSLPNGFVHVYQGVSETDISCAESGHCQMDSLDHLEARLLWSTSLASQLDVASGVEQATAIDLGAGVGLSCAVLARRGARVTCADFEPRALELMSRTARANLVSIQPVLFDFQRPRKDWPEAIRPPYDIIVLAGTPQNFLLNGLSSLMKVFKALGRNGTRIFMEDQSVSCERAGIPARAWSRFGIKLEHSVDPFQVGLWPMPCSRLYTAVIR